MIIVYGFSPSGNCHKVRLLLEQLGREYQWVEVRSDDGSTRTPTFLAKNPNGRVPIIELDDGRILAESNAILFWLAEEAAPTKGKYLPVDPWQRAQALGWMFFEQYSHEPYIAVARFICGWTPLDSPRRAELPRCRERGHAALAVMEATPGSATVVHRSGLWNRRHRIVRLYRCRRSRRFRPHPLSSAARLAGAGARDAGFRAHARARCRSIGTNHSVNQDTGFPHSRE